MTRMRWRLVEIASSMLKPDERDAVLGDFAESGETGEQALRGVLGLILRRQTKLWKDWRPWLVLVGVLIPLAWLLSIAANLTAGGSAVYLWFYLNNWDWTLLRYASFWYFLRDAAIVVSGQYAILICWAWSAGFLLGSASRRIVPVNVFLFCLISVLGEILVASRYLGHWFRPAQSDPISALLVYRELFPVFVLVVLVVIPLVWAMRWSAGVRRLPKLVRIVSLTAAAMTVIGMTLRTPGLGFFVRAHKQLAFLHGWPNQFLQLVVYWPIVYLIGGAIGHHSHIRVHPAH